jgi:hypothetical protein
MATFASPAWSDVPLEVILFEDRRAPVGVMRQAFSMSVSTWWRRAAAR